NIVVTATEDEGLGEVKSTNINVELSELNLDEDSPIFVDEDDNPVEDYTFEYNENSLDSDVIGTVAAVDGDGENVTYSITTNVSNDADEPLFEIDANSGEISLTAAGVAAFTNDFELASNVHNIVVTATEDEGSMATVKMSPTALLPMSPTTPMSHCLKSTPTPVKSA
ncbi:cadherin repeat domain-containing protein, partial [Vibrio sinaloensis]|uniref:cadherin repeat domain-containing protein n=1 Tax=Photobacterium sp. (strain ATCC 43367) TaxID=379097 RepID=UPI002F3E4B34